MTTTRALAELMEQERLGTAPALVNSTDINNGLRCWNRSYGFGVVTGTVNQGPWFFFRVVGQGVAYLCTADTYLECDEEFPAA